MNFVLHLQVRSEKWSKMISQEENMKIIQNFIDKADFRVFVIYLTTSGLLVPINSFPSSTRNKAIYFVKRFVGYI